MPRRAKEDALLDLLNERRQASDAMGSGDPYFIPTYKGDNPPVFQVYHDVSDKANVILAKACRQVAPSLSELFLQARLQSA